MDIKFSVALVTDVEDRQVFRPIRFIYCKKGFLFDNGAGMLLRVRYEKVRDWSVREGFFSIQVKDKWILREYDLKPQNEMQLKALAKYMNKYVPREHKVETSIQEPIEIKESEIQEQSVEDEYVQELLNEIQEQEKEPECIVDMNDYMPDFMNEIRKMIEKP